ncbi:MAG: molybdopterin-binding protein, partial [Gordonia sp. (in: high G+C Gram-positive bacteria)]
CAERRAHRERVRPLAQAEGGVLAEPLRADRPFPPFDASAMDGFAVAGPGPWRLVDATRAAGHVESAALATGQAARIATGAMLPEGADRVIRHEETDLQHDVLTETGSVRDDTRRIGNAWRAGELLAETGLSVDQSVLSTARAAGVPSASVRGPLCAAVHTTGDEVVPLAEGDLRPGQIPDTASAPVAAILREHGLHAAVGRHLSDSPETFAELFAAPGDADLFVVIGATGHGVADHLRAALHRVDAAVLVDGVALRPGGSLMVAQLPGGVVVLGLGGNPLAAVAGAATFTSSILDGLACRTPAVADVLAVVDDDLVRHRDQWRVLPVEPDGDGRWLVSPGAGTGHLRAMIGHRGLALFPPAGRTPDRVERVR